MADLLVKQANLAKDSVWQDRVKQAMLVAMTNVQGEAVSGASDTVYAKRQNHATAVLSNPNLYVERYAWGAATNATIASTIGNPVSISSSTNANPIVITTAAAHGYSTGDTVVINNHLVNTNANGGWIVTVVTSTTFSIPQAGNGVGVATGTVTRQPSDSDLQFTINSLVSDFAGITAKD